MTTFKLHQNGSLRVYNFIYYINEMAQLSNCFPQTQPILLRVHQTAYWNRTIILKYVLFDVLTFVKTQLNVNQYLPRRVNINNEKTKKRKAKNCEKVNFCPVGRSEWWTARSSRLESSFKPVLESSLHLKVGVSTRPPNFELCG